MGALGPFYEVLEGCLLGASHGENLVGDEFGWCKSMLFDNRWTLLRLAYEASPDQAILDSFYRPNVIILRTQSTATDPNQVDKLRVICCNSSLE